MSESLNPSEGVRLLLERQEVDEDEQRAHYAATIFTVTARYSYHAQLAMDGSAVLRAQGDSASCDDEDKLIKLAKSTARAAKRKRTDKLAPWPPRVLRWRGPGRG